jgi:hypothetical protein
MNKRYQVLALTAGLLLSAAPAWADGFQSYRVCGGDKFVTCSAVEITVSGSNVTMRVWNLSGFHGSRPGTVFNSIGFYNMPAGVVFVPGSGSVSGPARPGDNPGNWVIQNGGKVSFPVDNRLVIPNLNNLDNGIASGCATAAELPGSGTDLYQNPCSEDLSNPADWVTFSFQISGGSWDPTTSDIAIRGVDGATGEIVECWTDATPGGRAANCTPITPVPEPVTLTLLASGLAGMSGITFYRKRRRLDS